jgi:hypothetical protein
VSYSERYYSPRTPYALKVQAIYLITLSNSILSIALRSSSFSLFSYQFVDRRLYSAYVLYALRIRSRSSIN